MAAERVEVAAEFLDVDRHVRNGLRPVDEDEGAGRVRHLDHLADRIDRAERVADVGERDKLRLEAQEHLEDVESEDAVIGDRDELEVAVALLDEELPRDEVRVMLHLGQHDRIAALDVPPAPRVRDEVDRLGRVAGEDDLVAVRGVDEPGDARACRLVRGRRLLTDRVDPAMDVRVVAAVVRGDRIEHRARLLARGRRVEVDERMPVDQLIEDRELVAQRDRIEGPGRLGGERHRRTPAQPATSAASSSAPAGACGTSSASSGRSGLRPASRRIGP